MSLFATIMVSASLLLVVALPVAGVVAAARPTRANRWIAAACALVAVTAVAMVGSMLWTGATSTCPPSAGQCYDDSGVELLMTALPALIAVVNVVPGLAAWRQRPPQSRPTAPSTWTASTPPTPR